jgi:hypothetical protein
LHGDHRRIDNRRAMAIDDAYADGSPIARQEWRALRRIRRLQMASTLLFAAVFAGLLLQVVTIVQAGMVTAEAGRNYYSIWEWIWMGVWAMALAGEAIVRGLLDRIICPKCGHEFFRVSPRAPIETRRAPFRKASAFARLTRVVGQCCRNCDLSLGLAALPEPPESTPSRA